MSVYQYFPYCIHKDGVVDMCLYWGGTINNVVYSRADAISVFYQYVGEGLDEVGSTSCGIVMYLFVIQKHGWCHPHCARGNDAGRYRSVWGQY